MPAPAIAQVPASSIAQVRAFRRAQKDLAELEAKHPAVFKKLRELATVYNATLEAADHAVRAQRVSCDPFVLDHYAAKVKPSALCEAVGRAEFVRLGGSIGTTETFEIDRKIFDALVARGELGEETVAAAVTYIPHYGRLSPLSIP